MFKPWLVLWSHKRGEGDLTRLMALFCFHFTQRTQIIILSLYKTKNAANNNNYYVTYITDSTYRTRRTTQYLQT